MKFQAEPSNRRRAPLCRWASRAVVGSRTDVHSAKQSVRWRL